MSSENGPHIFRLARTPLISPIILLLSSIIVCIYYINVNGGSLILYFLLSLSSVLFITVTIPFLENRSVIIDNDKIFTFSFGKSLNFSFCDCIYEVTVRDDKAVSYRFDIDGKKTQISPSSYQDSDEMDMLFNNIKNKCKHNIPEKDA
ncbi:MAG: hypothetical protein HOL17_00030 [Gammaproteobacteria bacterium]|jgi:hypothetical protein|nr:hypothetical protein [Gammaproteobacteria bacterium]MBT5370092.1 hypothetical protein [Gammaproteobacteria bacterium]MBT5467833.1 hypothetical protein [Candidatus Neomarinimicrobiota bacterium]MBT5747526.1 hypothetical protein [Gammaproteobacteria bacterium]MBT7831633.1 hypothetical protein [Candidatus Neomarinimicrobiota bacterium]